MYKVAFNNVTEVTAPTAEPVSLAETKDHLRVDINDDDNLILGLIQAAREYAEEYLGRSLIQRTYRADLPYFADDIWLPRGPVVSIGSIKYWDTSSPSVQQTWAATNYQLYYDVVKRTHGAAFESVYPRPDAVQITYTAGYLDTSSPQAENVPYALKAAMLLMVGDLYEHRESQVLYPGQLLNNPTMTRLLDAFRAYR